MAKLKKQEKRVRIYRLTCLWRKYKVALLEQVKKLLNIRASKAKGSFTYCSAKQESSGCTKSASKRVSNEAQRQSKQIPSSKLKCKEVLKIISKKNLNRSDHVNLVKCMANSEILVANILKNKT